MVLEAGTRVHNEVIADELYVAWLEVQMKAVKAPGAVVALECATAGPGDESAAVARHHAERVAGLIFQAGAVEDQLDVTRGARRKRIDN